MSLPLPAPMYQRLSDLQSGIDDWYSPSQMQAYGQQCRADALKEAAQAALDAPLKSATQPIREACANAIMRLI